MTSKEFIEWDMLGCSYNKKKHYEQVLKDLEEKEKQEKELKEYKSIEEELGINLIKVLKAIKQGYIFKELGDGSIVKVDVDMLNFDEGFKCGIFSKTYSEGTNLQCYKMDTYLNSETWWLKEDKSE